LLSLLLLSFSDSPIKKLYKPQIYQKFFPGNILISIYQVLFEELKILKITVIVAYSTQAVPAINGNSSILKKSQA